MKKILVGLGTIAAIATPVASTIACGAADHKLDGQLHPGANQGGAGQGTNQGGANQGTNQNGANQGGVGQGANQNGANQGGVGQGTNQNGANQGGAGQGANQNAGNGQGNPTPKIDGTLTPTKTEEEMMAWESDFNKNFEHKWKTLGEVINALGITAIGNIPLNGLVKDYIVIFPGVSLMETGTFIIRLWKVDASHMPTGEEWKLQVKVA